MARDCCRSNSSDQTWTLRWTTLVQGKRRSETVNRSYFYSLLFTRENLRLVHIVCHDKQEHSSMVCDSKQFYTK